MYSTLLYTGALFVGFVASSVVYFTFQPTIKGWRGERKVNKVLKKLQKQGHGKNIKNLTLLDKDGLSSQIDHLFVNRSGIFVVETKNYSGEISGGENDPKWIQRTGKKEYAINNFARQNLNHIKVLRSLLSEYHSLPVYSFLSFNPDCNLNLDLYRTTATRYTTLGNAIKIRSRKYVLTEQQVNEIYKTLKAEKSKNLLVSKTHVSRVNLQQEADMHARNMNMSRNEYNEMLVEKYKKRASYLSDFDDINAEKLDTVLNKASERSHEKFSGNNHSKTNRSQRGSRI